MKATAKYGKNIVPGDYILVGQEPFIPALQVHGIDDGYGVRRLFGKDDTWVLEVGNEDILSVADLGGFVVKKPS